MTHSLLSGLPDIYDSEDDIEDAGASESSPQAFEEASKDETVQDINASIPRDKTVTHDPAPSMTEDTSRDTSLAPSEDPSVSDESTLTPLEEDTLVDPSVAEADKEVDTLSTTEDLGQKNPVAENRQLKAALDDSEIDETETGTGVESPQAGDMDAPEVTVDESTTLLDTEASSSEHSQDHERENTRSSSSSSNESHAPHKPRISLSSLLELADELYSRYPPTHPDVNLQTIMGPQSVMLTWSEKFFDLPSDNTAEVMVTQPQLIVLPVPDEFDSKEQEEDEDDGRKGTIAKRRRRKLRKPVRIGAMVVERRAVVASAVIVLGVAMAVYGLQTAPERNHGATKELRKLTRYVGGLVLGMSGRLWHGLVKR